METFEAIQKLLNLGWPAIVMLAIWLLWLDYKRVINAYIADLREMAGLRASLSPAATQGQKNRPAVVPGGNGGT